LSFDTGGNWLDGGAGEYILRAIATEKLRFMRGLAFRGSRLTTEETDREANMVVLILVMPSLTQLSSSNCEVV
jgi:hypothetical protein